MNEQQAFHAWLISDENKHGCWGLSGLEIDQMLVAWRARAKLGAGLPPKRIKLEHLMNEFPDTQINEAIERQIHALGSVPLRPLYAFVRDIIKKDRAQRPAEPYDQTALELCSVCGWKTLIPGDGCLNCERDQRQAEPTADDALHFAITLVTHGDASADGLNPALVACLRERLEERQAGQEPAGYERIEEEGAATFDPLYLRGKQIPGPSLNGATYRPVYTAPPPAQVPLTDEQIKETLIAAGYVPQWPSGDIHPSAYAGVRAIEQAHHIK